MSLCLRYGYGLRRTASIKTFKLEQGISSASMLRRQDREDLLLETRSSLRPVEGAALNNSTRFAMHQVYVAAMFRRRISLRRRRLSLVTALMSEALGGGVRTFPSADDERYSELPYAKEAADRLKQHRQEVLSRICRQILAAACGRFGEPFSIVRAADVAGVAGRRARREDGAVGRWWRRIVRATTAILRSRARNAALADLSGSLEHRGNSRPGHSRRRAPAPARRASSPARYVRRG